MNYKKRYKEDFQKSFHVKDIPIQNKLVFSSASPKLPRSGRRIRIVSSCFASLLIMFIALFFIFPRQENSKSPASNNTIPSTPQQDFELPGSTNIGEATFSESSISITEESSDHS